MPIPFDNSYVRLPDAFFTPIEPTPVSAPVMIRLNHDLVTELGIDVARLDSPEGLAILSGNQCADGSEPLAMAAARFCSVKSSAMTAFATTSNSKAPARRHSRDAATDAQR